MSVLYNCHTDGDQYRITKFDSLGNVESSYLCTSSTCECPAGHRPSCRHRHMLPRFIAKDAVNSFYFYDYDRQGWVTNEPNGQMQSYFKDEPIAPKGPASAQELEQVNRIYAEEDCPGHIASENNPKVCSRCGVHIDSLRPIEEEPELLHPAQPAPLRRRL